MMWRLYARFSSAILVSVLFSGCAVTPPPLLDERTAAFDEPRLPGLQATPAAWWRALGDPTLDRLVDIALTHNFSIQAAQARMVEARGADDAAIWSLMPSGIASRTASNSRVRAYMTEAIAVSPSSDAKASTQGIFSVSWELPLFGKGAAVLAQGAALARQQQWTLSSARIAVASEVVRSYAEYRGIQGTVRLLERNISIINELVQCEDLMRRAGLSTEADVAVQRASLLDVQTQYADSRARRSQLVAKLDGLLGQPEGVASLLPQAEGIPLRPPAVIAVHARDLRLRPDIRAAEENVALAAARAGIAAANLWPQFSLGGALDFTAGSLDATGATRGMSSILTTRAGLQIPLLDWFSRKAEAQAKDVELLAVTLDYRQAVVLGWEETRVAFIDYQAAEERFRLAQQATKLAQDELFRQRSFQDAGIGTRQARLHAEYALADKEKDEVANQFAVVQQWAKLTKASFATSTSPKLASSLATSPGAE